MTSSWTSTADPSSGRNVFEILGDKKVGNDVKLTYLRDGERHEVSIKLE